MKKVLIIVLAMASTLGLFLVMNHLINKPQQTIKEPVKIIEAPVMVEPKPEESQPTSVPQLPAASIEPALGDSMDIQITETQISPLEPINIDGVTIDTFELPEFYTLAGQGGLGTDRQAMALFQVTPHYPPEALSKGIEGWVKLSYDVTVQGLATNIKIIQAEPRKVFNTAAKKALMRWKFKVGRENGQAVGLQNQTVVMQFNLDSGLANK